MRRTKSVRYRLETVGVAVDIFSLDGANGIHDLLLHFWWPVGCELEKLFEFVRHGELVVIEMGA